MQSIPAARGTIASLELFPFARFLTAIFVILTTVVRCVCAVLRCPGPSQRGEERADEAGGLHEKAAEGYQGSGYGGKNAHAYYRVSSISFEGSKTRIMKNRQGSCSITCSSNTFEGRNVYNKGGGGGPESALVVPRVLYSGYH